MKILLKLWACLMTVATFTCCKPNIKITSENEPANDSEALTLVGLTMTTPPEVLYRNFQAGMDDRLDLVIRFPKNHIQDFWDNSKWAKKDALEMAEQDSSIHTIYQKRVKQIAPGQNNQVLNLLRKSTNGIWCSSPEGR